MKLKYVSIVGILVLLFTHLSYAEDSNFPNPYIKDYPFKSAVIHYSVKNKSIHGKKAKGKQIVYIKSDKLAKVKKMTVPDSKGKTKQVEILRIFTPDYIYMIDLKKKKGVKVDNSNKYGKAAYKKLSEKEKKAFHKRMEDRGVISLDLLGLGRKVGKDTVLGHICDVYQSGKKLDPQKMLEAIETGEGSYYIKSCIWREAKIPLKVESTSLNGSYELVATKIEENVKISDSRFTVPSDVEITYDEKKSEFAKKKTLSRFELYKTGKPKVVRMKLEKEKVETKNKKNSEKNESNESGETEPKESK